jgi:hypothetical protein
MHGNEVSVSKRIKLHKQKEKKNYGGDISGAESDRNLELLGRERWRADA